MVIVILLIGISLLIALIFLGVFYWNIRSGQYDDLYTPSVRMLFGEEEKEGKT
jgi:cbb3-type cytochrome oxidase maturation protein